jgi:LPS sulfotransferase NodH
VTTTTVSPHHVGTLELVVRGLPSATATLHGCAFAEQGVRLQEVVSEDLIDDPGGTVLGVLECLRLVAPSDWRPQSEHVRQADGVNQEWVRRYVQGRP